MIKSHLKELVMNIPKVNKLYFRLRGKKAYNLIYEREISKYIEQAERVMLERKPNIRVGLAKIADDYSDLGLVAIRDYYPKYERLLKNNNMDYEYFNPLLSNWIEKAQSFDLIVWHTNSDPSTQEIAEGKIYLLEKMGKKCLPSYDELWSYENKIRANYLYKLYDLPSIPTFITHSKTEAISYLESAEFPIISKISTGSSSYGVEKIESVSQGKKLIKEIFSYKGRETYFSYYNQKNYVYFQEFIDDATYDLRVICINNELFGYYRYPNDGDFKASGAGNYEKKEIPIEALELAYQVCQTLNSSLLATDFVYSNKLQKFLIIESSIFIGVDSCEQLCIDGIAGKYVRRSANQYDFVEGKYWIQELALKSVIEKNF